MGLFGVVCASAARAVLLVGLPARLRLWCAEFLAVAFARRCLFFLPKL
jgi:hypothetical protein